MDVAKKLEGLDCKRKGLTAFGLAATFAYFGLVIWLSTNGEDRFAALKPNEIGDFMAGTFAPVAFLWLVVGYFLQAIELKQNSESLMQQAEEMRNAVKQAAEQAEALRGSEGLSRQDVLNQTRTKYEADLAMLAAQIMMKMYNTSAREQWGFYNSGDILVFCRWLHSKFASELSEWGKFMEAHRERVCSHEVSDLVDNYINLFNSFIRALESIGGKEEFYGHYMFSPFGYLKNDLEKIVEGRG